MDILQYLLYVQLHRFYQSPLWIASFDGRLDEVKKLIEAGADVNQANKVGVK